MTVKFITMKGVSSIAATPYYVGLVQHERTMSRRETYEYCAERTGYKATAIRAVFMALAEYIKENQRRGNITYLDGVASIRNYVKGAFAGLSGKKFLDALGIRRIEPNDVNLTPMLLGEKFTRHAAQAILHRNGVDAGAGQPGKTVK